MKHICAVLVGLLAFTQVLADSRQVRFSTDEGTWMSLDVSPDASSIVFELVGDLYVMPISGGKARRLTDGPAFDAQPRYSPDGRSILFVSDRSGAENLWALDVETSAARALTQETGAFFISPEWTPDGKQIVVSKSTKDVSHGRHYQLFVYSADGSGARQLTGTESRQAPASLAVLGAAFGSDSQRLFAAFQVKPKWPSTATWQIGTVDVATGASRQLTEELNSAVRPTISPDGRSMVYATEWEGRTHLKVLELASRKSRWLVSDIDRSARETAPRRDLLPGAAFTPDGSALVYSNHGHLWRVALSDGTITPVLFTADVDVQLAPLAHFDYAIDGRHVDARRIEQPQLSPDGKMLAFSALGRIWVQEMRGRSRPRQISEGGDTAFFPTWSPDGRYLAYVTWNDLQGGGISRVDMQSRRSPERLPVANDFYEKLAYSPDGRRIVAARSLFNERFSFYNENLGIGRGNSRELVWLPAEGGAATVITHINPVTYWGASSHYGRPHFGKDATRVYFTDPVEGLMSVTWDGTQRESLLRIEGPGFAKQELATEMMLSPDGTRVLSMLNNQAWLVDLPVRAGSDPKLPIVVLPADSPALPSRRLSRQGADFPQWSADGRTVTWSLGSTFFTREVARDAPVQSHDVLVRVARDVPKGSIVLRGARVITMRGEEIIQPADVVVTDDRIVAVGAQGTVRVPKDARIFDVAGKTILPGYVDVHWHGAAPWGVHRTQVWEFQANLAYGVTSIRDPQPASMDALTYGDRIASGEVLGPRYFTTGRGIFVNDGIRSRDDARDVAERHGKFYRTETLKDYMTNADRQVHQWLMDGAREYKLTPTAEGNSDFKWSLTRVFDGFSGQEHMTTATAFYRDLAQLFASSGVTITPTVLEGQPGGQDRLERFVHEHGLHRDAKVRHYFPTAEIEALEVAARKGPLQTTYTSAELMAQPLAVLAAGGKIALGVHGAIQGIGAHWALWTYVEGGMRPHDALRAATIVGANAIGHGKNFGSIEAGKLADLQILDGDPLQDIRQSLSLRYVMINGRLYETDKLDQVWPQAKQLDAQWWQLEPRVRAE